MFSVKGCHKIQFSIGNYSKSFESDAVNFSRRLDAPEHSNAILYLSRTSGLSLIKKKLLRAKILSEIQQSGKMKLSRKLKRLEVRLKILGTLEW